MHAEMPWSFSLATRTPEFGTISFHFLGTDKDKIKIMGGNIIGKKLFICGKILS
jgi:hypothetical protein